MSESVLASSATWSVSARGRLAAAWRSARRRDVLRLIVGQGLTIVLMGLVVGAAAALPLARVIGRLLGLKALRYTTAR